MLGDCEVRTQGEVRVLPRTSDTRYNNSPDSGVDTYPVDNSYQRFLEYTVCSWI